MSTLTPLEKRPVLPAEPASDLVRRALAGDAEAFDALCREHGDRLYQQALLLCGDRETAEDLVQETLVAAWRSLARFHGGCRFFTWLCSILIHRHLTLCRRRRPISLARWFGFGRDDSDGVRGLESEPAVDAAGRSVTPASEAEAREHAVSVRRCLDRLPPKLREVVWLRFYAGDSLEGIAAVLGCPLGTVKSRLSKGLDRLRGMRAIVEHRNSIPNP